MSFSCKDVRNVFSPYFTLIFVSHYDIYIIKTLENFGVVQHSNANGKLRSIRRLLIDFPTLGRRTQAWDGLELTATAPVRDSWGHCALVVCSPTESRRPLTWLIKFPPKPIILRVSVVWLRVIQTCTDNMPVLYDTPEYKHTGNLRASTVTCH